MVVQREELRSVPLQGGEIRRLLVTIGHEPVVLFQKSHPILRPRFKSRRDWRTFAGQACADAAANAELKLWNRGLRFEFNCHTLAVGAFFGLGPNVWLEGSCSLFTLLENPTQTLLDAYFERLATEPVSDTLPECVKDDDVVVFSEAANGDLVHSGRVKTTAAGPVVISKLGEHPAALTSLSALTREYRGQYSRIELYRALCARAELTGGSRDNDSE
jgi:hypothetical protein